MTITAANMEPGQFYRLTRDCWPGSYYMRCPDATRRQLEKRLLSRDPRTMKPDDLRAWQALESCRVRGLVLGIRFLRFRDESGAKHESRDYVAFPVDYPLRAVAKPPGYGGLKRKEEGMLPDGDNNEEAEDDSRGAGSTGSEDTGRRDHEDPGAHL